MNRRFRSPFSLHVARGLSAVAVGIPFWAGIWGLLFFDLWKHTPAGSQLLNIDGFWALAGGVVALIWTLPLMVCAIAVWFRRAWGCIGMASLSLLQGIVQTALLHSPSQAMRQPRLAAYTGFLFVLAAVAVIAAVQVLRRRSQSPESAGFPVIVPATPQQRGQPKPWLAAEVAESYRKPTEQ